jgi:hypothetical protein
MSKSIGEDVRLYSWWGGLKSIRHHVLSIKVAMQDNLLSGVHGMVRMHHPVSQVQRSGFALIGFDHEGNIAQGKSHYPADLSRWS